MKKTAIWEENRPLIGERSKGRFGATVNSLTNAGCRPRGEITMIQRRGVAEP